MRSTNAFSADEPVHLVGFADEDSTHLSEAELEDLSDFMSQPNSEDFSEEVEEEGEDME